jgi:hypothetical protein
MGVKRVRHKFPLLTNLVGSINSARSWLLPDLLTNSINSQLDSLFGVRYFSASYPTIGGKLCGYAAFLFYFLAGDGAVGNFSARDANKCQTKPAKVLKYIKPRFWAIIS